jgi:hypothetical protein
MTQCAAAGRISHKIGGSNSYQYRPVSIEDLTLAIETALTNFADAKGQNFMINGADEITLKEILHLAEASVGKAEGMTKL